MSKKTFTLTEKMLIFIAGLNDLQRNAFSLNAILGWQSGNPAYYRSTLAAYHSIDKKKQRKKLLDTFFYLKRKGYIYHKSQDLDKEKCYAVTPKGELKMLHIQIDSKKRKKLPHGQWFIVFFDIPEKMREKRDFLRNEITAIGFHLLQKSIWVTSLDVREEFKKLRKLMEMEKYCKFLIIKEIDESLDIEKKRQ